MRIAFIVEAFPSLSETFILNQITGILDLGHEVEIFAKIHSQQKKVHLDVEQYDLKQKTHYMPTIPQNKIIRLLKALLLISKNFYKSPLTIVKALNIFKYGKNAISLRNLYYVIPFLKKNYDIIHCHFGPNGNLGALLKDVGIRDKLVTTFHAYDLTSYVRREGSNVYQHLFQIGDLFLTVSDTGKRKLKDLGCDPHKILVHHMGVDAERFPFKERHLGHDDPIKVLTVGRFVEKKGINYAINAVSLLLKRGYDITYIIAGNGPLKSYLANLIVQLGAQKKIKLIGSVDRDEVRALMMNSDIFLLPSVTGSNGDQEGIPVVLMEAMATGMPVISTYHSGIPELVENGKSGFLVPERDVEALVDRLIYLIKNQEVWPSMGRAGREFVEKKYNIKKLIKRLVTIYQELIK